MSRRDSERPQLPWQGPEDGPGAGTIFLLVMILFIGMAVALFVGTGLVLGGG